MSIAMVLLPLIVLVIMTFLLGVWMGVLRVAAVRAGSVHPRDIALREPNWPPHVTQVANAFHNQFETPVLFYLLTVLALITRTADLAFVLLAWVFVALRAGHAYVHVTDNNVPRRALIYFAATTVLGIMWLIFIVRILLAP